MRVPAGRRLVFESLGWRGTALLLNVRYEPRSAVPASAEQQEGGSTPRSPARPSTAGEAAGAQRGAPPSSGRTPRHGDAARDSGGSGHRPSRPQAAAAGGYPAAGGATLRPLHDDERIDDCTGHVRSIISKGQDGWLHTDDVYTVMQELREWDLGLEPLQPENPTGAALLLALVLKWARKLSLQRLQCRGSSPRHEADVLPCPSCHPQLATCTSRCTASTPRARAGWTAAPAS